MDDFKDISSDLSKMKKDLPFQVPEHYFENFPERLNEKIRSKKRLPSFERKVMALRPYLAAAIVIIVALVSGNLIFRNINEKRAAKDLHSEISQVVEWELYSISEETILEVMNYTGYQEEIPVQDSRDEIIDYLVNEDIPYDELINAF